MSSPVPEETIAAIVTASGEAGVSIVRVSGPDARTIGDTVFRGQGPEPSKRRPGSFAYGRIVDARDAVLDEVLLLVMQAPHSYTGEDVIEIQGHGGRICAQRILRRVMEAGARLAEPGEFTRRAFLNGRMDLLQAEAVLDLIRAHSERASAAAIEQLEGGLSSQFNTLYDELLLGAARIEATLDFPEDELPEALLPELADQLTQTRERLEDLVATWEEGHLLRDGVRVVIAGRPNVGKSTLLNLLLEQDRAIVSSTPGTTRDHIEEEIILDGIPLRLVDTAGLRETDCAIEQEGIARTRRQMEHADLHIFITDASEPADEELLTQLESLQAASSILVLNKCDCGERLELPDNFSAPVVRTILIDGRGLEELRTTLRQLLAPGQDLSARPHAVISERHRRLLVETRRDLDEALERLRTNQPDQVVLATSLLRGALESLGQATGREYEEDLLDAIFSQFCIGK